jgi:hypothetical protein
VPGGGGGRGDGEGGGTDGVDVGQGRGEHEDEAESEGDAMLNSTRMERPQGRLQQADCSWAKCAGTAGKGIRNVPECRSGAERSEQ